jgi:hypothetical protein
VKKVRNAGNKKNPAKTLAFFHSSGYDKNS